MLSFGVMAFKKAKPMSRRSYIKTSAVTVGGMTMAGCSGSRNDDDGTNITLYTGTEDTASYSMGQGIAALFAEHVDGVSIESPPSPGTERNPIDLAEGNADIGLTTDWSAHHINEELEPYHEIDEEYAEISNFYVVHWILGSTEDWKSTSDYESGSTVSPGAAGSLPASIVPVALDYSTNDNEYVNISPSEQRSALEEGRIDAGFGGIVNGVVEPAWFQEMKAVDLTVAEWGAMNELESDPRLSIDPVDMSGMEGYEYTPGEFSVPFSSYSLITTRDANPDMVNAFLDGLYDIRDQLADQHALLGWLEDIEWWVNYSLEFPYHDAAKSFYNDVGAL